MGNVTLSMLWLNSSLRVKLCEPLGRVTLSMPRLKHMHRFIVLGQMSSSANGQCHIVHALVEFFAKGQALRATGQSHLVHAPVEAYASVTRKSLRCVVLSSLDHINDPVIQD